MWFRAKATSDCLAEPSSRPDHMMVYCSHQLPSLPHSVIGPPEVPWCWCQHFQAPLSTGKQHRVLSETSHSRSPPRVVCKRQLPQVGSSTVVRLTHLAGGGKLGCTPFCPCNERCGMEDFSLYIMENSLVMSFPSHSPGKHRVGDWLFQDDLMHACRTIWWCSARCFCLGCLHSLPLLPGLPTRWWDEDYWMDACTHHVAALSLGVCSI